jgi:uncharacterized membrane protein
MENHKLKAVIAHFTFIGWIIAVIMNTNQKEEYSSFYIRQMLGLILVAIIGSLIPILKYFIGVIIFVAWVLSLISALSDKKVATPVVGHYFQDWFNGL